MKKKSLLALTLVLLLGLLFVFPSLPVNADSGWDTDYGSSSYGSGSGRGSSRHGSDSGGYSRDYDRGSSSSSSSGYSSSSSSSSINCTHPACHVIFKVCMIIIIIVLVGSVPVMFYLIIKSIVGLIQFHREYSVPKELKHRPGYYDEELGKLIPGYTEKALLDELYHDFISIQNAWMNFDYDTLERLCVDELYQSYRSDLEVLRLKNGKNIMSDFQLEEYYVNSIKNVHNQIVINISLSVSFLDYVIDTETNKVIRGGKKNPVHNTYSLTYVIDVDKTRKIICPNCGAEVNGKKCGYCHSHVKEAHHHFKLSKKSRS